MWVHACARICRQTSLIQVTVYLIHVHTKMSHANTQRYVRTNESAHIMREREREKRERKRERIDLLCFVERNDVVF